MSGGSFNYLCFADLSTGKSDSLTAMAAELDRYPGGQFAAEMTRSIATHAEDWQRRLYDVWHAVEWWQSGDWGQESVTEALAAFNQSYQPGQPWHRFPCGCSMEIGSDGKPTGRSELGCEGHRALAERVGARGPTP